MSLIAATAQQLTTDQRITATRFFNHRIVQVGGQSSTQTTETLWQLLDVIGRSNYHSGLAELEEFLAENPLSPWAPSLDAALGEHYFKTGSDLSSKTR